MGQLASWGLIMASLLCQNTEHTQDNRSVMTENILFVTSKLTKHK